MPLLMNLFCGKNFSFSLTPTNVSNINYIRLSAGIFDSLFVSKNSNIEYDESKRQWDFDTKIFAHFRNNLFGGNVDYTSDIVSAIRVKRRKKGIYKWDTIYEIPIKTNEDFKFERFDRTVRSKTDYQYSLVPVINNIEGNLNTNEIKTDFEGFYFIEKETVIRAILNAAISSTNRNFSGNIIETKGREKPFFITNSKLNYESGTIQATFIDQDLNNEWDIENAWKYRQQVDDFLSNGKPKILKCDDGRMWLVAIVPNSVKNVVSHHDNVITTINWVEIGDAENVADLIDNGFLDLDPRLVRS